MNDTVAYGDTPIVVTSSRVIVLTGDYTISAYDAAAGNLIWSRKLKSNDMTLRLMGGSLFVLDSTDDTFYTDVYVLDPISGNETNHLSPSCMISEYDNRLSSDDGLVYLPANNDLVLIYESGCIQRIDLSNNQVLWSSTAEDRYSFSFDGLQSLLTDQALYFTSGNQLIQVNLSDGTEKALIDNSDYEVTPLAIRDGSLLVQAKRTQGSTRYELWAVDTSTGSTQWQINFKQAEPISGPDTMAGLVDDTDWGWTWHLTDTGLDVLTFKGQPNEMTIDSYDLTNGNSLSSQTISLKRISSDFYSIPTVLDWIGDVAYMNIEGNIYSIDLATNKLDVIY